MEFFKDNFTNTDEQITPIKAVVKGTIPAWLSGSFYRLGPGLFDLSQEFSMNHFFDGYGVVIKFHLENGQVTFMKKFLQTDAYIRATSVKKPVFTEFGTRSYPDPKKGLFSRMLSSLVPTDLTDNDSTNIFVIGNHIFVSSETCFIRCIDPITLDTKDSKIDLHKLLGANLVGCHPITDRRGDTYNMAISYTSGLKYHVIKIPAQTDNTLDGESLFKNAKLLATFSSSWKTCFGYHHSFGLSENYIVFMEQPLLVNSLKLLASQIKGSSLIECTEWSPAEKNRFILIRKSDGVILKTKLQCLTPFFIFHFINCYEEGDSIVVDAVTYPSPEILYKLNLHRLRKGEFSEKDPSQVQRFVVPIVDDVRNVAENKDLVQIKSTTATAERQGNAIILQPESICETGVEYPVISKRHQSAPYKYVYATSAFDRGHFKNGLAKVDLATKTSTMWRENDCYYPGEPQFVPCPDATEEDDGVLLATVTDVRTDHNDFLVVLDARTMKEVARAEVDSHIPQLLHGLYVPATE